MHLIQWSSVPKNRLVMGDPVSEAPNGVKAAMDLCSGFAASGSKGSMKTFAPERVVVTASEEADPEAKPELCNYFSGSQRLSFLP